LVRNPTNEAALSGAKTPQVTILAICNLPASERPLTPKTGRRLIGDHFVKVGSGN
jgi:hypothetical protein